MSLLPVLPTFVVALASVAIFWLVLWLATRAIAGVAAHVHAHGDAAAHAEWTLRLARFARGMISFVALLALAFVTLRGLGVRGVPDLSAEQLVGWATGPGLRLILIATTAYLVIRAGHFLIDSLEVLLLARDASGADLLERRKRVDTLAQLLRVVVTLIVVSVGVLMALSLFNVDIRPILTGAGIAGLAVGFGAQNLVRDVIAGFFLILENQVRLGDVVVINGKDGLVEAIRLRTIVLRGFDGTVHVIPNGGITELSNMTKDFSYAVLTLGVSYATDLDEAMTLLRDVGADLQADPVFGPKILEPIEVVGVESLGGSSIEIKARIKTVPLEQWNVGRELRRRVKIAFDGRGIELPHPQVPVYLGVSKPNARTPDKAEVVDRTPPPPPTAAVPPR